MACPDTAAAFRGMHRRCREILWKSVGREGAFRRNIIRTFAHDETRFRHATLRARVALTLDESEMSRTPMRRHRSVDGAGSTALDEIAVLRDGIRAMSHEGRYAPGFADIRMRENP